MRILIFNHSSSYKLAVIFKLLLVIFFSLINRNLFGNNLDTQNRLCNLLTEYGFNEVEVIEQSDKKLLCKSNIIINKLEGDHPAIVSYALKKIDKEKYNLILKLKLHDVGNENLINIANEEFVSYINILFAKYVRCKIAVNFSYYLNDKKTYKKNICARDIHLKTYKNTKDNIYISKFAII